MARKLGRFVVNVLGPKPERYFFAHAIAQFFFVNSGNTKHHLFRFEDKFSVLQANFAVQKIHRRATHKARHKFIDGFVKKVHRRVKLLHFAVFQDYDAVAHGHGLHLVVGYIDHRRVELAVEAFDFGTHLHAQFGIEVRERLVKQKHLRLAHNRAANGHALALPTRHIFGAAVE